MVVHGYRPRVALGAEAQDCPNLLWELMRCRREKLNAQQLQSRNISERFVDKDNHARDAMKYVLMSWPGPSVSRVYDQRMEMVKELFEAGDPTSGVIRYLQIKAESQTSPGPIYLGRYRTRWRRR